MSLVILTLLPSEPAKCLSQGSKVLFVVSFKSLISLHLGVAYDVKLEGLSQELGVNNRDTQD
jgi:hypothetical protein